MKVLTGAELEAEEATGAAVVVGAVVGGGATLDGADQETVSGAAEVEARI